MQLGLGAHVLSGDGDDLGTITRLVVEPRTMGIREFVIREGVLFRVERVVAADLVERVTDAKTVYLKLTLDAALNLPAFAPEGSLPIFTASPYAGERDVIRIVKGSVPRDAVVLSHRTDVYDNHQHRIGNLDEVIYDDAGRVTAFVVDAGFLRLRDTVMPISTIDHVNHDRIELNVPLGELIEGVLSR